MGSAEEWSNGLEIPTNVPRLDWRGCLAGFVCKDIVSRLAFPALDQPLILQGSQQEPRRIDALAIEQTPQVNGSEPVAVIAGGEDLAPGHPLLGEEPPGVIGHQGLFYA